MIDHTDRYTAGTPGEQTQDRTERMHAAVDRNALAIDRFAVPGDNEPAPSQTAIREAGLRAVDAATELRRRAYRLAEGLERSTTTKQIRERWAEAEEAMVALNDATDEVEAATQRWKNLGKPLDKWAEADTLRHRGAA